MCVRLVVSRGAPDDCKREQACGRPDALRLRVCGMVFIARRCFARLACDLGVPAGRSAKSIRLIAPPDRLVPSIWTLPITASSRDECFCRFGTALLYQRTGFAHL